jgi:hypothetical protein
VARRLITVEERRARIGIRHLLTPSTRHDDVGRIADAVVALHSSDPVSVFLSATARMAEPGLAAVEQALYADRRLVRHHAMRRTLWVMTPEVTRLAHASATRRIAVAERRRTIALLADNDVADDPEAWLDMARHQVLAALHRLGQTTTRHLGEEVPALRAPLRISAGKAYEAVIAAHTRVLLLLGFEGLIVRTRPLGTWVSGQYRWASMADWVPGWPASSAGHLDPRVASADLVRRWLHAFGPGTTEDVRWWTGWPLATVRRALEDAGAVEVGLPGGNNGWLAADDVDVEELRAHDVEPWVALLPALDPTTMGWKERDWYLASEHVPLLFDRNGNGGPTIWADGRIVGGWAPLPDGRVALGVLEDVGAEHRAAIDAAAGALEALLGPTRITVRFKAPLL